MARGRCRRQAGQHPDVGFRQRRQLLYHLHRHRPSDRRQWHGHILRPMCWLPAISVLLSLGLHQDNALQTLAYTLRMSVIEHI
jgi:hypothetical protein